MRGITVCALLVSGLIANGAAVAKASWALAIHGGAGVIARGDLSAEQERAYRASLNAALEAGARVLRDGGRSVDAVEAAITLLEDDPLFNAGRGSVFTADGRIELDASIMDGNGQRAGAVTGVTRTKNPISLARVVMDQGQHVMLAGEGADAYSVEHGLPQVDPSYFRTDRRWKELEEWRVQQGAANGQARLRSPDAAAPLGTVGAVALDTQGHLAAGTSTGGITGKLWGRVGDSPIIGAGTYAVDGVCAVSATGTGEYFIRSSAARQVCDRVAWKREKVQAAADATIASIGAIGGDGGLIAMDATGRIAFAMNSPGMYRGSISSAASAKTAIYAGE
jgi:beta-aspartyl-peptidase (threonine type)